jgi:hypothetical protein
MTKMAYDIRTYDPRFDRRPTLLLWALATAVCVLVLVVATFVMVQPAAPPSTTNANPAALSGTGSSDYAEDPSTVAFERHPEVVAALSE